MNSATDYILETCSDEEKKSLHEKRIKFIYKNYD